MNDLEKADVIIREVCKFFDIPIKTIKQNSLKREVVECRQFCMFYIREKTALSLDRIGKIFNKDHATVLYSIKNVKNLIKFNGYDERDAWMRFTVNVAIQLSEYDWTNGIAQL